jgi:hypothetical protein
MTSKDSAPGVPSPAKDKAAVCDGEGSRPAYTRTDAEREVYAAILRVVRRDMQAEIEAAERLYREKQPGRSGLSGWELLTVAEATRDVLMELRVHAGEVPRCTDYSPPGFTGRWRDWHRGHGCDRDDGKPRSPEGAAEIAALPKLRCRCEVNQSTGCPVHG